MNEFTTFIAHDMQLEIPSLASARWNDPAKNTECSGSAFALNLSDPLNTELHDRKRRTVWLAFLVVHEVTELD
ncbi:hypothetical protein C1N51_20800 [Vibrio campbellii]|nr:hypothetical protein C1N51_20800 [Vibrio campbellii]